MGNNVNLEEYAIKFLLYSYFKLTLNSDTESILNSIVERAYQDATMQGAYNAKLSNLWGKKSTLDNKENIKKDMLNSSAKAKKKSFELLQKFVNELPSKDNYDKKHGELCGKILDAYKKVNNQYNKYMGQCGHEYKIFTYGNAQKWVNMTMKYMLIIHGIFHIYAENDEFENDYGETLDILIPYLHVPIDNYIIEAIWENKNATDLPIIKLLKDGTRGKYSSEKVKAWSDWDKDKNYIPVHDNTKAIADEQGKSPIIWEGDAWIEQAMKRNKAEKKSNPNTKPQE